MPRPVPVIVRSIGFFAVMLAVVMAPLPVAVTAAVPAAAAPAPAMPDRGDPTADETSAYVAAIGAAETHNRAAIAALTAGDRDGARAAIAAFDEAFGRLLERFGTRVGRVRAEPDAGLSDGVTIMVDVPMRVIAARMMIDFGRPDIAATSLRAVCRHLVALHPAPAAGAATSCDTAPP
ncbi:hypothetical protein RHODGE_RHODGE_02783 [Rhodoplanes serenus]|uniref:Uncharacterized protein n=1 Tax=Rhodoplanes serenus TaxID=200615 RepID=A0A447CWA0_9BRAD|nr:hypothetical protein [Rhodoplanes serenus]VCU09612.1 hypothetical protein RHODGE_RHODGE_02783 [Rhodoplanes serenus]